MIPTTDPRPRQSPARRSKIVAGTLSAGALAAIVIGMATTAHDGPTTPANGAGNGGGSTMTGTFPSAEPVTPAAIPAPVPARAPALSTPPVPDGVSRASGG